MQIVLVKYFQVFCMTIFFTNNVSCDQLVSQNGLERQRTFAVTACTSGCMSRNANLTLKDCYEDCLENSPLNVHQSLKLIHENLDMYLLCRDANTLVLKITRNDPNRNGSSTDTLDDEDEDLGRRPALYVVQVHLKDKEITYLANSSLITIENLAPSTKYNISATVVYKTFQYSSIALGHQFSTLQKRYKPKEITSIEILKYEKNNFDPHTLDAVVTWKPAIDRTCNYEIVYYSPNRRDVDVTPVPIVKPESLYTHTLEGLSFDTEYSIAVRGKNKNDVAKEGILVWQPITTPKCLEWYNNNLTLCPPLQPTGLDVDEQHITANIYSLNVTWNKPLLEPDYYLVKVLDLTLMQNSDGNSLSVNVSRGQTFVFLPGVTLTGHQYEILLTAFSLGGNCSALSRHTKTPLQVPEKHQVLKLLVAIVVPIICIAVASLLIVVICHRRAKLKRYQERCKYFEELEEKAPVDPKSTFQFISKNLPIIPPASNVHHISSLQQDLESILYINDEMELERENVALLEVLGEGAFGLVRKGILKITENEDREVAVKMLKNHPSSDDIKEFRREIEVMKFVGKHPNIVGIVGHCTKNINEMLLLTEYCSLGNLLNFLRSEWNYLNKIKFSEEVYQPTPVENLTPFLASQKQPENVFNFDTSIVDKVPVKYKNIGSTAKSITLSKTTRKKEPEVNNPEQLVRELKSVGSCTNSCKCEVDIVPNDDKCLKEREFKVRVHSCECGGKNELKIPPMAVENQGYYKLLSDNKENSQKCLLSQTTKRERLTSGDLLQIAKQVATGMEFLSKNRVVHRDLAARNVLVCDDRTVKIADFGLSRDIYQENIYKKIGNGKLPIKWLALESMTHQVYTSQSDVWAYGILLYEIVTLGSTPYPSIPTNQLLDLLKTGYRMEKPKNCNEQFYDLMLSCWDVNPSERPSFTGICQALDNMLFNSCEEEIINLNLTEIVNKRSKSSSDESYLKPL